METFWPWLAIAGVGAVHALNPATGWMFAAACGVRAGDRTRVMTAMLPIGAGHIVSIALVAGAFALGLSLDRVAMQLLAGGLLAVVVLCLLSRGTPKRVRAPAGHAGLALWSFVMSTAHGAGLMLLPALMPLCFGGAAGKVTASGSLILALAAGTVHTASMLLTTGLIAAGVFRYFETRPGWFASLRRVPAAPR